MTDTHHITLEMDKLRNAKDQAKNQGNHIEAEADGIDARRLRARRAAGEDNVAERAGTGVTGGGGGGGGADAGRAGAKSPLPNGGRRPSFSFPGYNGNGFVTLDGVETPIPDVNAYQHKKTLAQGMMDLALLSANANQLRYVLETNRQHPYFYPSLLFISLSIIFQVAVGVGLIWNGRYNIKKEEDICRANKINNYTVIGIFIVTVVNVLISAFGVAERPPLVTTT
ncbi:hypothetical protein KR222_008993 [Zaprionus bogoriensis]|nr:hypothetical protein KR222_008993 [Zaprionus bogoriensis]